MAAVLACLQAAPLGTGNTQACRLCMVPACSWCNRRMWASTWLRSSRRHSEAAAAAAAVAAAAPGLPGGRASMMRMPAALMLQPKPSGQAPLPLVVVALAELGVAAAALPAQAQQPAPLMSTASPASGGTPAAGCGRGPAAARHTPMSKQQRRPGLRPARRSSRSQGRASSTSACASRNV